MMQYRRQPEMKVCSSCGAVYYYSDGDKCPYCGQKRIQEKNFFWPSVLALFLGMAALIGIFFNFFAVLIAAAGLIYGSMIIKRAENFYPLALFGMVFSILSILIFLFTFGTRLYYILQFFL